METCAVIVVVSQQRAEQTLLAGDMPCPRCQGVLRPFGNGRTRTVRGVGADTVTLTPRRARCRDCSATQILLPTELVLRRADSTEPHAQWLYRRAVDQAVTIDRELLVRPAAQPTTLGHALNLLAGAAVRFRECFGRSDPVWSQIGFFARGRLLAAPRPPLRS